MLSLLLKKLKLLFIIQARYPIFQPKSCVCHAAVAHHSDEDEEEEQEASPRPTNGMLYQLSSRTPSSPFSFVTDILMSSFPYPANTSRPQTAPPTLSHGGRNRSLTEQAARGLRHYSSSPIWRGHAGSAEFEDASRPYRSIIEEEEDPRNISRASCPGASFNGYDSVRRDADLSVFQINEEHYFTEESGWIQTPFNFVG